MISFISQEKNDTSSNKKKAERRTESSGKRELAPRHYKRQKFWTELIARADGRAGVLKSKTPGVENYLNIPSGVSGYGFLFNITMNNTRVEMYIETYDKEKNKQLFDQLFDEKIEIEKVFGNSLTWDRLEDSRSCLIRYQLDRGGLQDEDKWPEVQEKMINNMVKFQEALRPHLINVK
jgi:hypothetical protein